MDAKILNDYEKARDDLQNWRKKSREMPFAEHSEGHNERRKQVVGLRQSVRESITQEDLEQAILAHLERRHQEMCLRLDTYGEVAHGVAVQLGLDRDLEKAIVLRVKRRIERLVTKAQILEFRNDEVGEHRSYGYTGQTRVYALPAHWAALAAADQEQEQEADRTLGRAVQVVKELRKWGVEATLVDGGKSLQASLSDFEKILQRDPLN